MGAENPTPEMMTKYESMPGVCQVCKGNSLADVCLLCENPEERAELEPVGLALLPASVRPVLSNSSTSSFKSVDESGEVGNELALVGGMEAASSPMCHDASDGALHIMCAMLDGDRYECTVNPATATLQEVIESISAHCTEPSSEIRTLELFAEEGHPLFGSALGNTFS